MKTPRQDALTTQTNKGLMATKRNPSDPSRPLTDGERVYYTLATNQMIPYRPEDHDKVRGGLNTAVHSADSLSPIAAHRTRKAVAKMTEVLIKQGLLSQEELDEILLAAVDFQEMEPVTVTGDAGQHRR